MRKDASSLARQAMQWNPLDGIGRRWADPATRGDKLWRECQNLNKAWPDLKQLVQFGGELALLMPHVPVGIKEIKKKKRKYFHDIIFYS